MFQKKHCVILSNLLLKNDSMFCTPRSGKESGLKILKFFLNLRYSND